MSMRRDTLDTWSRKEDSLAKVEKIAVLIKDLEQQYEGVRTSLGLLLEAAWVYMYVLDHENVV